MNIRKIAFPFLLVATGCGAESLDWASSEHGVAPTGSNSAIVSNDIPTTVAAGERFDVTVRMRNTGTNGSPNNDWDTNYRFTNVAGGFLFGNKRVDAAAVPVTPTNETDFNFVLTMPNTGSRNFIAQMFTDSPGESGFFGEVMNLPITVSADPNFLRRWDCSYVSDTIPAVMTPGQVANVSVTVRNEGTANWTSGGFCLYARDTPSVLWGGVFCPALTTNANGATQLNPGTGETATFTFQITAPATEGTFNFRRQMFDLTSVANGGVGFFDNTNFCVDETIVVSSGATEPHDATFVAGQSNIDDANMATWRPGEQRRVSVTMTNTGITTWTNGAFEYLLFSQSSPSTAFKPVPYDQVDTNTATNESHTFTFYARAPTTPGVVNHAWRMWSPSALPNFFGDLVTFPVTVDAGAALQLDATIDAQVIPATVNRFSPTEFRVTVRNTGFLTWDSSEFGLFSVGSPNFVWGVTFVPLPNGVTVPPGGTHEFVVSGTSPSAPGTYESNWQMRTTVGGFNFGAATNNNVNVVAGCGNGTVEAGAGEQCDDGNLTNGDGCSSTCQFESISVDLSTVNAADRTLFGVQSARDLSTVAIGDVNGDMIPDVAVGAYSTVTATAPNRALAGEVWVHSGVGFRTSTETLASQNALLHVWGARANDFLGGGSDGSIKIADVTGDGNADLIVSATFAACNDGNNQCGRVYVITGGGGFPTGSLDLANPGAALAAQLIAPTDGDGAIILAVADLTGDGVADLVVGHPNSNGGRGRVVVVAGGAGLTGTIVTSAGNVAAEIIGAAADDQLGRVAAIGQLDGAGNADLVVGSARHDPAGGSGAGGAWGLFSPITGSIDLSATFNVRWFGPGVRDALGSHVAIADVSGDGNPDVLIGTVGTRFAGNTRFGTVDVWNGPFTNGTTFDMSAAATPDVAIQGREAAGNFGKCVGAGDFDGNGTQDVFGVGFTSSGAGGGLIQAGELAVLRGGAGLTSQQIATGTTPFIAFGGSDRARMCMYQNGLAIADLDGDGRDDFCVASPQATVAASGLFNEGRVDCIISPF